MLIDHFVTILPMPGETVRYRAVEDRHAVERYMTMKSIGRDLFADSHVVQTGRVNSTDIDLAYRFIADSARETDSEVSASFWCHLLITPEFIKSLSEEANAHGISVDTDAMVFAGVLHDAARLAYPSAYARNDLILDRMLKDFGIPKSVIDVLPSFIERLEIASAMDFSEEQLRGDTGLKHHQSVLLNAYLRSLTPEQIIFNVADNLSKRNHVGVLTMNDLRTYLLYLDGTVYNGESVWPSVKNALAKRREHALFQWHLVRRSVDWLSENGIPLDPIRENLKDYGARLVVAVRHGEVENPRGIVYNRDSVMDPADIVRLSDEGRMQIRGLGERLSARRFRFTGMLVSPNTRTLESAGELSRVSGITPDTDDRLDDTYAPNVYLSGMSMDQFQEEFKGDIYDVSVWGATHERPETIAARISDVVRDMRDSLSAGEAGMVVTHGDPLAWFLNQEETGQLPAPQTLRNSRYPPKGSAVVFVYGPDDSLFTSYFIHGTGKKY
ncbi:hypothetical protein A2Z33_03900 [Candidatus Gottesmanbacteria bacterium RBG_16_52_11]|uniref:Uncharacterized protein n=1 Tax=Candidatus Gottesmanbacteria bacterium RBG_16_52_11 TaxID=1798374 RepID=A0A1F5YVW7_9BACT|nr:MAG: hypothetical protein A2Z33_03900 [Candidatus Gottesmanbacteria bacterium RBG_16_52_11]